MRTKTALKLTLSDSRDVVLAEVGPNYLKVVGLEGGVLQTWQRQTVLKLGRPLKDGEASKLIAKIRIAPYGARNKLPDELERGSRIKLFMDDRSGQKPFREDTVADIETKVTTGH